MKLFLFQKYFKTEHKFAKRSLYYEKQQSFIVSTNFVLLCLVTFTRAMLWQLLKFSRMSQAEMESDFAGNLLNRKITEFELLLIY